MIEHELLTTTVRVTGKNVIKHFENRNKTILKTTTPGTDSENRSTSLKPDRKKKQKETRKRYLRKSKHKMIIDVPSVGKTRDLKACGGRILEGIQEDFDENEETNSNHDNLKHKADFTGPPTSTNTRMSSTTLSNVSAQQNILKRNDTDNANSKSNDKEGTKRSPLPLVRSHTIASISPEKLVTRTGIEHQDNRRKFGSLPSLFRRSGTELSLGKTQRDATLQASDQSGTREADRKSKHMSGWTKRELEIFLPRKSFFSVHDNALSKAGVFIMSDEERKRPEWRKHLRMRTMEELHPSATKEEEEEDSAPSSFANTITWSTDYKEDERVESLLENTRPQSPEDGDKDGSQTTHKWHYNPKKSNDREGYRPLYDYLKYIHDNPQEYIQMTKFSPKNLDYRHPDRLVRMGRAFRRGARRTSRNSIYLHALADIKQTSPDVGYQRHGKGERAANRKDSHDILETMTNADETEIEKLKAKAEKWIKAQTTHRFLRAKELVLRDMGVEDVTNTKWWIALKDCMYIRVLHPQASMVRESMC